LTEFTTHLTFAASEAGPAGSRVRLRRIQNHDHMVWS